MTKEQKLLAVVHSANEFVDFLRKNANGPEMEILVSYSDRIIGNKFCILFNDLEGKLIPFRSMKTGKIFATVQLEQES